MRAYRVVPPPGPPPHPHAPVMTSSVLAAPTVERTALRPRLARIHYEPAPGLRPNSTDPPPPGAAAEPAAATVHRSAPSDPLTGGEVSRAERREVQRTVTGQLRAALEVFDGRRPAAHIADLVTPSVLRYWRAAARQRRVRVPTRFARIRLCLPRSGVAEVAVTCEIDGRPRALAARFERTRGRWLCTTVRLG
jgi:hypothetical protein